MSTNNQGIIYVRKIQEWKSSYIVSIPKAWLRSLQHITGKKIQYLVMKVDPQKIIVEPLLDESLVQKLYGKEK